MNVQGEVKDEKDGEENEKDVNQQDRTVAADALGIIGNQTAIAALIDALNANDAFVRASAAKALGEIGPRAKAAVGSLQKLLLQEAYGSVRQEAIIALGKIGPAAKAALPDLVGVAKFDDDVFLSDLATDAIEKISMPGFKRARPRPTPRTPCRVGP